MTPPMVRLRRVMAALADAMGEGWAVADETDPTTYHPYPAIGVGESDGYRRLAVVRDPKLGWYHRGSPVRRALEVWSQGGDWRWTVDDGEGCLRVGQASALLRAVEAAWAALWAATVDPVDLVAELLRREQAQAWREQLAEMGEPIIERRLGIVRWGFKTADGDRAPWLDRDGWCITIVADPGGPEDEGWPLVRHGRRERHLRELVPTAERAARLAALAVKYATRTIDSGWNRSEGQVPAFLAAGPWVARPVTPPPLPVKVGEACGALGSIVDDWQDRLRAALGEETRRVWEARKVRVDARADRRLALPGDGLDPYGRELSYGGQPVGNARLGVPVEVVGALWALGLPLRWISAVTTGRDTSRNTINRWIKQMKGAPPPGWTARSTAGALIDDLDLAWARSWCQLDLDEAAEAATERPVPAAGVVDGTGETGDDARPEGGELADAGTAAGAPVDDEGRPTADAGGGDGTKRKKRRKRRRKGPDPVKVALQSVAHAITQIAPTMRARTHWPGQRDNDVSLEAELGGYGGYVDFFDPARSPSRMANVHWFIIWLRRDDDGWRWRIALRLDAAFRAEREIWCGDEIGHIGVVAAAAVWAAIDAGMMTQRMAYQTLLREHAEQPRCIAPLVEPKATAEVERPDPIDPAALTAALDARGVDWERDDVTGEVLVALPGEDWLVITDPERGRAWRCPLGEEIAVTGGFVASVLREVDAALAARPTPLPAPPRPAVASPAPIEGAPPRPAVSAEREAEDPARLRWLDFVAGLPDDSRRFLALVRSRGTVALGDVMDALSIEAPKRIGGITGAIGRWAPVKGVPVPYEATSVDGERAWRWIGGPETQA